MRKHGVSVFGQARVSARGGGGGNSGSAPVPANNLSESKTKREAAHMGECLLHML